MINELILQAGNGLIGLEVWDNNFWELLIRFAVNLLVSGVVLHFGYSRRGANNNYQFSFFVFSIVVFFVVYMLNHLQLNTGFALGLFAIFAILRYRTTTIAIREMTYLFVIIGLAVINALTRQNVSVMELAFSNLVIMTATVVFDKWWIGFKNDEETMEVSYDNLELLRSRDKAAVVAELKQQTGEEVCSYKILEIRRSRAKLKVSYKKAT